MLLEVLKHYRWQVLCVARPRLPPRPPPPRRLYSHPQPLHPVTLPIPRSRILITTFPTLGVVTCNAFCLCTCARGCVVREKGALGDGMKGRPQEFLERMQTALSKSVRDFTVRAPPPPPLFSLMKPTPHHTLRRCLMPSTGWYHCRGVCASQASAVGCVRVSSKCCGACHMQGVGVSCSCTCQRTK